MAQMFKQMWKGLPWWFKVIFFLSFALSFTAAGAVIYAIVRAVHRFC